MDKLIYYLFIFLLNVIWIHFYWKNASACLYNNFQWSDFQRMNDRISGTKQTKCILNAMVVRLTAKICVSICRLESVLYARNIFYCVHNTVRKRYYWCACICMCYCVFAYIGLCIQYSLHRTVVLCFHIRTYTINANYFGCHRISIAFTIYLVWKYQIEIRSIALCKSLHYKLLYRQADAFSQ